MLEEEKMTTLGYDEETSFNLGVLAKTEERKKNEEVRFLVKKRLSELGLKWRELQLK